MRILERPAPRIQRIMLLHPDFTFAAQHRIRLRDILHDPKAMRLFDLGCHMAAQRLGARLIAERADKTVRTSLSFVAVCDPTDRNTLKRQMNEALAITLSPILQAPYHKSVTDRIISCITRRDALTDARSPFHHGFLRVRSAWFFLAVCSCLQAQDAPGPYNWEDDRFWLSFQANFIRQQHPSFPVKYSGPNSLDPNAEHDTSRIETLYSGIRLTKNLEFLLDIESAGGFGLSNALGVAGFPNVDVVRNPSLSENPYVSRVMLHYTLPLSDTLVDQARNP